MRKQICCHLVVYERIKRNHKRAIIFQKFIYEHNLWGTTAVLALSVHATVENNNLNFYSINIFFIILSFLASVMQESTARGESTDWVSDSTDDSINTPLAPIAAPTICTQFNYIVQKKARKTNEIKRKETKATYYITRSILSLLEPHILCKIGLVQRGGCKRSWAIIIYNFIYNISFSLLTTRGKFTQPSSPTQIYHRCQKG